MKEEKKNHGGRILREYGVEWIFFWRGYYSLDAGKFVIYIKYRTT